MSKEKKVVVYTGNRTVYPDMITATKALLMHNRIDEVWYLTEDDPEDFPYDVPDVVHIKNVSDQKWFPKDSPNYKTRFSYLVLIRAVFPYIFPEYDKILSMDIDTIVIGDISGLWDYRLDDYYLAAVEEPSSRMGEKNHKEGMYYVLQNEYYNVGVTMYNLKKMREDGIVEKVVDLLNSREFYSVEQDALNIVCGGKILGLPSDYNASRTWTAPTDNPLIAHFAGVALEKWRREPIVKYFERKSWADVFNEML